MLRLKKTDVRHNRSPRDYRPKVVLSMGGGRGGGGGGGGGEDCSNRWLAKLKLTFVGRKRKSDIRGTSHLIYGLWHDFPIRERPSVQDS